MLWTLGNKKLFNVFDANRTFVHILPIPPFSGARAQKHSLWSFPPPHGTAAFSCFNIFAGGLCHLVFSWNSSPDVTTCDFDNGCESNYVYTRFIRVALISSASWIQALNTQPMWTVLIPIGFISLSDHGCCTSRHNIRRRQLWCSQFESLKM